jgi:HEPN domain-containing protein
MIKSKSFDEQLSLVSGKVHYVNFANDYERFRDSLLSYWNRAEALHSGAQIINHANGPFEVFSLLAGLSIELVLKGIHRALDKDVPQHHRLHDLCSSVGIAVSANDRVILRSLSEQVYWASRYPVPKNPRDLAAAQELFDKQRRKSGNLRDYYIEEREINNNNYERLWNLLAGYYHKAQESRIESVVFKRGG